MYNNPFLHGFFNKNPCSSLSFLHCYLNNNPCTITLSYTDFLIKIRVALSPFLHGYLTKYPCRKCKLQTAFLKHCFSMKSPCGILRDIIDHWKNPIWYTVLQKTEKIRVQPQCRKCYFVVVYLSPTFIQIL